MTSKFSIWREVQAGIVFALTVGLIAILDVANASAMQIADRQSGPASVDSSNSVTGKYVDELAIEQAVSLAVANDPRFQQIRWEIEKAKGERRQATRLPNPGVGISGNEIGNDGSGGQYGIFWSETVVRNNSRAIQQKYFSIAIAALQQQYEVRRWEIARNVGSAFLNAIRYQEELFIVARQMESVQSIRRITNDLFEAGEISQIAVSNIDLELQSLRQKLVELQLKAEFEIRALAIPLAIQVDVNTRLNLQWSDAVEELMSEDSTRFDENWIQNHPQVNFAKAMVEQCRWKIQLARADRCPDVNWQGGLTYDMETDDVFAGFQVQVPVLKCDRKQGAINAATAEYQGKLESVRLKEMQLEARYTLQAGEIARLRSRVGNLRNVIIPKAKANLAQIQQAFKIGEAEFVLLKSGLDQVLKSRVELLQAEYDLAIASINLKTMLLDK